MTEITNTTAPVSAENAHTGQSVNTVNTDSTQGYEPKWYDALPERLRTNKTIQKFDNHEKALDSLIHANQLLGKRIQEIPHAELREFISAEEIMAIRQK